VIVITIAATRMHRSLVEFASGSTEVYEILHFLFFFFFFFSFSVWHILLGHMKIAH
jgi:hypothetical protein